MSKGQMRVIKSISMSDHRDQLTQFTSLKGTAKNHGYLGGPPTFYHLLFDSDIPDLPVAASETTESDSPGAHSAIAVRRSMRTLHAVRCAIILLIMSIMDVVAVNIERLLDDAQSLSAASL